MIQEGGRFKLKAFNAQAVIIDNGSGLCKAGISGEVSPRHVIASVLGCPKSTVTLSKGKQKECYVGEEAQSRRELLSLRYPIECGMVTSWDDMEKIWKHIYDKGLGMKAFERPVLMTEPSLNPNENRSKLAQVMFELFRVPALYLSIQAILSLYASAQFTGLVMDSGYGMSQSVPVYEGYCLPHAVNVLNIGGREITEFLKKKLLESRQYSSAISEESNMVEDIKVKLCFVAQEDAYNDQNRSSNEPPKEYELPDGNRINLGDALFLAPDILFAPANIVRNGQGLHKMIAKSIKKCDPSIRRMLYSNVLLAGGSSLFPGLDDRVFKGLENQVPHGIPIKVRAPPDRWFSAWIGASIITSLSTFKQMWVTAADYREFGPNIILRRCF